MATFTRATKRRAKLRAAIFGPSGAGKTFTSLRLATGIGGKIAVIDSERGSASKYADRFEFDVADLGSDQHGIADYVSTIKDAASAGYDVLIIDSLSHAWQELLAEVEALSKSSRHKGNTWSAWSEGTPKQKSLVNAILDFPGHVIATMRSKTEWTSADGQNGRKSPIRVGLTPEQGKGIEYEFDMLFELSTDHVLSVLKDRSGKFQDRCIENPGETLGSEMAQWLDDGAVMLSLSEQIKAQAKAVGLTEYGYQSMLTQLKVITIDQVDKKLQQQLLNQALQTPAVIQAWNDGLHSKTGEPLAGPEQAEEEEHGTMVLATDDELPALWATAAASS
jgi:hypothetical protein